MDLRELFGSDAPPVDVTALAYDNRAVGPGTVFFCVRGMTRDGHEFAPDAVARGAAALVVDHPLGLGVPEVLVNDVRAAMAPAAAKLAGGPRGEAGGRPYGEAAARRHHGHERQDDVGLHRAVAAGGRRAPEGADGNGGFGHR